MANSNLAYRGTLTDVCEFLGIAPRNSRNNRSIKETIQRLEADGFIKSIQDGRTFTLTLTTKAEHRQRVISIRRDWVNLIKEYKSESNPVDWINILKVWLYLIDNQLEVITSSMIAECLNVSVSTVSRAKRVLEKDLNAIQCRKRGTMRGELYRCLGQTITVSAWIDE